MKNITKIFAITILAMSMVLVGCNKEQNNEQNNEPEEPTTSVVPVVATSEVTGITNVSAVCGGVVTSDGGHSIVEKGVCYGTEHNPLVTSLHLVSVGGMGSFTVTLTGLEPNTTYYVRAYAINSVGIAYGEEVSFTTQQDLPMIKVIEQDGYAHDGLIVDNALPIKFGFEMSSFVGLARLEISYVINFLGAEVTVEHKMVALNGETSYTYINDETFFVDFTGQVTFIATVWDVESRSSTASFAIQLKKMAPTISIIGGNEYLYDGQVVDVDVPYEYGFHMESTEGLSSLAIRAEHSAGYLLLDGADLDGALDYSFVGSVTFFAEREIVGECTFTAEVTDVNGRTSSASFTVYINQDQMLIPSSFEWCRYGANPGTGLEEFGLYWDRNSKDIYARIKPLDGVSLFSFDPTVWNEVDTEAEKAALFLSALETQPSLYEYANVSATMVSADYDDVIGTVLPDGTMHLIHVTHCTAEYRDKALYITITGECK